MMMEDKFTVSGRHTIQYTDQVSQKCTPETYMILLTNIAAINLIKKTTCDNGIISELLLLISSIFTFFSSISMLLLYNPM